MKYKVYRWKNKINDKSYIGQTSTSLENRSTVHISQAKSGSRYKFHQAIRKHGVDNFDVDILFETDSLEEVLEAEKRFIKEHDSYANGYNMTEGGQGSPCSIEKALKISETKKGKSLPHMFNNNYKSKWIWITDGVNNLRVRDTDLIPNGFRRGRINKPSKRLNGTKRPKFENGYK